MRRTPAKRNPLFKGIAPLSFDDMDNDELLELTSNQKMDKFLSRWLEVFHPLTKYRRFFDEDNREVDHILKLIKNFYSRYILDEGWTEQKFVMVLDYILVNRAALSIKSFENGDELYDEERLPIQLTEKRLKGRGGRRL